MVLSARVVALSLVTGAVALGTGAVPAATQSSSYKTPSVGAWKVQDRFEYTAGGGMTVGKKGTRATNLKVTVGERNVEACGTGTVRVTKTLTIKRLGTAKRPAVGRIGKGSSLILPVTTTISANGTTQQGTVRVLFEKDGRSALSAEIEFGECRLEFALRRGK